MNDNSHCLGVGRSSWAALLAAGVFLSTSGCGSGPSGLRSPVAAVRELPDKIIPGQKDASLRKKVEADHFPTAQEAGIQ